MPETAELDSYSAHACSEMIHLMQLPHQYNMPETAEFDSYFAHACSEMIHLMQLPTNTTCLRRPN